MEGERQWEKAAAAAAAAGAARGRQGGFTLVELLMIVGILAVLASAILFNIHSVRQRADRVAAQAYLGAVIRAQELHHIAHGRYGDQGLENYTSASGETVRIGLVGLRRDGDLDPASPGVTTRVIEANSRRYCLQSVHERAPTEFYYATEEDGITRASCIGRAP